MKKEKILETLTDIARQLNIKVRQEKGDFAGGYCVKEQEPFVLLNKRHMVDKRICILAREIAAFDISGMAIPPAVMKVIESERKRATEIELETTADDE